MIFITPLKIYCWYIIRTTTMKEFPKQPKDPRSPGREGKYSLRETSHRLFSEKIAEGSFSDIKKLAPIGERLLLSNGAILERPNPQIIELLQSHDPRVQYFHTDTSALAKDIAPLQLYRKTIAEQIGYRVREDFPVLEEDSYLDNISLRGTVAALTTSFPYWPDDSGERVLPMNTVSDILTQGSDNGRDETGVGTITKAGEINRYTRDWINIHYDFAMQRLTGEQRDQTFPILLVYKWSSFEEPFFEVGVNQLIGKPSKRISALYITDKILVPPLS